MSTHLLSPFARYPGRDILAITKAAHRYNFHSEGHFTPYVVAYTDYTLKNTIAENRLIRIPCSTYGRAKQKGTQEYLYHLQPQSLDKQMTWYGTDDVKDLFTTPILPTDEAPPRNPAQRVQVETWLSYLSPQARQVLTLRYGLSDEDERMRTTAEIASILHLPRCTVQYIERDAALRIKALVEGTGTIVEQKGKRMVKNVQKFVPPTLTLEQEVIFMQAAIRLCEQGSTVTSDLLAKATGMPVNRAVVFLRLHRDEIPLVAPAKTTDIHLERLAHVARVCTELEAQGIHVTAKLLTKVAHVRNETALEFMRKRKQEVRDAAATQAR